MIKQFILVKSGGTDLFSSDGHPCCFHLAVALSLSVCSKTATVFEHSSHCALDLTMLQCLLALQLKMADCGMSFLFYVVVFESKLFLYQDAFVEDRVREQS